MNEAQILTGKKLAWPVITDNELFDSFRLQSSFAYKLNLEGRTRSVASLKRKESIGWRIQIKVNSSFRYSGFSWSVRCYGNAQTAKSFSPIVPYDRSSFDSFHLRIRRLRLEPQYSNVPYNCNRIKIISYLKVFDCGVIVSQGLCQMWNTWLIIDNSSIKRSCFGWVEYPLGCLATGGLVSVPTFLSSSHWINCKWIYE